MLKASIGKCTERLVVRAVGDGQSGVSECTRRVVIEEEKMNDVEVHE